MEQLKRLREARGLSQTKLAARADVNPATVNQIEGGKRTASPATLHKLAAALDVSLYELLEGEPHPKASASSQPSFNGLLEEERHSSRFSWAIIAAAAKWGEAMANPDMNDTKRFGLIEAALELSDVIAEKGVNHLKSSAQTEAERQRFQERREQIRQWTRRISA
jgi:transcriptional regulator with XRE-family HTH domain